MFKFSLFLIKGTFIPTYPLQISYEATGVTKIALTISVLFKSIEFLNKYFCTNQFRGRQIGQNYFPPPRPAK